MTINNIIEDIKKLEIKMKSNKEFLQENPFAFHTFIELLYYFINNKYPNKKDSYIYKKAHINAKLFSKLRNPQYHPSKKTIIALGLALELSIDKFELLLNSAGYSLALNNQFDIVIIYCIQNKIYNLFLVNEILYEIDL